MTSIPVEQSLLNAVTQGAFLTFIQNKAYNYDPVLWTMQIEFIGSMLCFGLAALLENIRHRPAIISIAIVIFTMLFLNEANPYYVSFIAGVALARFIDKINTIFMKTAIAIIAISLFILGYTPSAGGVYSIFDSTNILPVYVVSTGAVLLIIAIEKCSHIKNLMHTRAMAFVGELSFPLYLVHFLVMCSIGSHVFILTHSLFFTSIAVVFGSIACAIPLIWFNRYWVRGVNATIDGMLNERKPVSSR